MIGPEPSRTRGGPASAPRVVLTATGTLGDLLPMVAVAIRLRALGLRPVIAAMPEYRAAAAAQESPFHPVRPGLAELAAVGLDQQAVARAVSRDLRAGLDFAMPHLGATMADLDAAIRGAAMVVAGPLSVAARAIAARHGVPFVTLVLQPMAFLSALRPPRMREVPFADRLGRWCGAGSVRVLYRLAAAKGRGRFEALARWRCEHGLPPVADEIMDGISGSRAVFAMYPPAFAPLPPDAPARSASAGFAFHDGSPAGQTRLGGALPAFLDSGPPPLVFTLGSFVTHAPGRFYEESARAARALGRRAVLLGGDHAVDRFASLAGGSIAVAGSASHSLLFARAAAVVHHGGIGTAAQALRAGVPQLVCPLFGDQFDNGEHLRRLGVAEVLKLRRYAAEPAARSIARLGDHALAVRARALAPSMAAMDGAAIVAGWIADRARTVPLHAAA